MASGVPKTSISISRKGKMCFQAVLCRLWSKSNHEEADTRILVHIKDAISKGAWEFPGLHSRHRSHCVSSWTLP